jgi:hypothetical protein
MSFLLAMITSFSVVTNFCLIMENRAAPLGEMITRFFRFLAILTDSLGQYILTPPAITNMSLGNAEILTAITVYMQDWSISYF